MDLTVEFCNDRTYGKVFFDDNIEFLELTSSPTIECRIIDLIEFALVKLNVSPLEIYRYESISNDVDGKGRFLLFRLVD